MKTNFHTHCRRCGHANGSEEDYVLAAVKAGLAQLGFSDHGPFPDQVYGSRMPYSELPEYIAEIDRLREGYRAHITLWKGLEIEYLPESLSYYESLLAHQQLDYLLMGEHFYQKKAGERKYITSADSTEEYVIYAGQIAEGMKSGLFRAVVHPDIFMINPFPWDANCGRATDIILDAALRTNTVLEYNANGYRRGVHEYPDGPRCQYPHRRFWEAAAKSNVRIMVGSDCHHPAQVWDEAMDRAYQDLEKLGIEPVQTLFTSSQ